MSTANRQDSTYRFNLIHENLASTDCFPDKTHEAVADQLYKLIIESDRPCTIGLEGSWGAGKSTVIKFLESKIKSNTQKALFFTFDAWAHEGDPLRRIFLESLINSIDPKSENEALNKLKASITFRKKTVNVRTRQSTTKFANYLAISALFVPMGAALLSAVNYSQLKFFDLTLAINWPFAVGLITSLMPLLTIFYWKYVKKHGELNLIQTNSNENYTQDITEDGERTSIEFEKYFKEIISEQCHPEHRPLIIIVIDNLDRVDAQTALEMWSTLQPYFQHRSHERADQGDLMQNIWFIVPYDREAFSKIWAEEISESNGQVKEESVARGESFMSKCFQVRAEVPSPIISGWIEYFRYAIDKHLTGWPDTQRDTISKVYQRYFSRIDSSPTPRQINNCINQVGLLGIRWAEQFSAESIGLYAIYKLKYNEQQLRALLVNNQGLPDGYVAFSDLDVIKEEIAGLLFGVPASKGIELLLAPKITGSLYDQKGRNLSVLINNHPKAFWVVWQAIKSNVLPSSSSTEDYKFVATSCIYNAMREFRYEIAQDVDELENVWLLNFPSSHFKSLSYAEPLRQLLYLSESPGEFADSIRGSLLEKLRQELKQGVMDEKQVINFYEINNLLTEYNKEIKPTRFPELTADRWVIWTKITQKSNISCNFVLPAEGALTQLFNSSYMGPGREQEVLASLIYSVKYLNDLTEWAVVVKMLINILETTEIRSRPIEGQLIYKLMGLIFMHCSNETQLAVKDYVSSPRFSNSAPNRSDVFQAAAMLAGKVLGASLFEDQLPQNKFIKFWKTEVTDNQIASLKSSLDAYKFGDVYSQVGKHKKALLAHQLLEFRN